MSELGVFIYAGFDHLAGLDGVDHILYLWVLSSCFVVLGWRKLVWMITGFTLGHSISLLLSMVGWVAINPDVIEALIPITIAFSAIWLLFRKPNSDWRILVIGTTAVGLIHGLGFSNFLSEIQSSNLVTSLLGFNLGLEIAQVLILLVFVGIQLIFTKLTSTPHRTLGQWMNALGVLGCLILYII